MKTVFGNNQRIEATVCFKNQRHKGSTNKVLKMLL